MTRYQDLANADVAAGHSEHNVHDRYKHLTVEQRRHVCQNETIPFDVAILNVTGELNVSNIIRTASICGFSNVHILGRRRYDSRGAVGAEHYIPVHKHNVLKDSDSLTIDPDAVKAYFDHNNLLPVFVEQYDGYAEKYTLTTLSDLVFFNTDLISASSPLRKRLVFVFGNEGRGIPRDVISQYSIPFVVELSQRGVIRSFNVGSTAAIVMYAVAMCFTT